MAALLRRIAVSLVLVVATSGCTRTIDDGQYGPLQIGEGKTTTLESLERYGIGYITPQVTREIYVRNPTSATIQAFSSEVGLLVWVEGDPMPLRIEFDADTVQRTWPEMTVEEYHPPGIKHITEALHQTQNRLPAGTDRATVYEAIIDLASQFDVAVGNFVVGEDRFRHNPTMVWTEEYREFLYASDVWKFHGLKEQVWYPAFYSEVTLRFESGVLKQIEHWAFPFEMP